MKSLNTFRLFSILLFAFGMSSHLGMNAQDCIPGTLIFESNINDGGPQQIAYNLSNTDTFEMIEAGGTGLGNNEAQSISFCITEGCYTLTVQGNAEALNSGFFSTEIQLGGELITPEVSIFGGTIYYEFCTAEGFISCPQEIEVMPSPNPCGVFVFAIPGYENHPGISWFLPDGSTLIGGGIIEFAPELSGQYEVCAVLETPNCPLGVELCATFESNCDQNCEVFLSYDLTENGGVTVYADQIFGGVMPETYYEWVVDGEFTNNIGFALETSFDDCEEHQICVLAWNSFCESDACISIQTNGCEDNCPTEMWVGNNDCTYSFEVGSFQEGETATWYIGDQAFEGGHFFQHQFLASGTYDVCVDFSSELCSGTEICTTIEVEACNNCDATFFCDVVENQLFLSPINVNEDLVYTWFINDEYYTNEIFGMYQLMECGAYQVCLNVSDPQGDCDDWFCDVMVYDGCENDCPESINYGNDGCNYWFEVGSAWEDESVTWIIADMVFQGGHYLEVENLELSGEQVITAQINNGACEGQQITTFIEFNDPCGCSSAFEYTISDNGQLMAYPLEAYDPGIYYSWILDGEWFEGSQYEIAADLECGTHELCLYMESGNCLSNTCQDINVDCANCDLNLVALMDNCSGVFYIDNPDATEVLWYVEDGIVLSGNQVLFEFQIEGPYNVCASAVLPGCGTVDACITVETEFCQDNCTPVSFAMDSFVNNGGPQAAYMNISNENGDMWFLTSEYGPNEPYFDGELCLPDGCYNVLIDTPVGTDNPEAFFSAAFVNGEELEFTYGPTWNGVVYEYGFALNSDCGADQCSLAIDLINQNGNTYLFTAATDVWDQGISWFVDGEFVEMSANFDYTLASGEHEVCAMIETPACPDGVWSCMEIVVEEDEICVPILFQITADGELLEDLLLSYNAESLLGSIEGELLLSSIQGEATLLACIPEGCYNLTLGMEEGVLIPLLLNTFIDGEFSFEDVIDPMEESMSFEFGVNTECSNTISENIENQDLLIFPVPADLELNVVLPQNSIGAQWEIINATGQLISSGLIENGGLNRFDVSGFDAGVYHFQVRLLYHEERSLLHTTWLVLH